MLALAGVAGFFVLVGVWLRLLHQGLPVRDRQPKIVPAKFCSDCGQAFVKYRSLDGFDPQTGQVKFAESMACPEASPGESFYSSWPACGRTMASSPEKVGHFHPGEERSVTCHSCIDDMLADKVITSTDAVSLRWRMAQPKQEGTRLQFNHAAYREIFAQVAGEPEQRE